MSVKSLTCVECPKGCRLAVETDSQGRVVNITGNQCPKGEKYGKSETENPLRTVTSTVLAQGLSLRMIPVRTDQPIPRARVFEAMALIKTIQVTKPVFTGEIIVRGFLGIAGVNLVATRDVRK